MSVNNTVHFTPATFSPTKEQVDIQTSSAKAVIVEANAGAAKTTTLALRIAEALGRGVPPDKILALVFTSEAKDVFKNRLQQIGIPYAKASKIRVETIDGFASKVLDDFDADAPEKVLAMNGLKPLVIKAINKVGVDYGSTYEGLELATHNTAVSQFINTQLILKASMSPCRDFDGMTIDEVAFEQGVTLTHWLIFLTYEQLRNNVFDGALYRGSFDSTYDLARKLSESPELGNQLPFYRLLVCDELHDLSEAAYRILMALLANGRTYFCGAGDKDQVIYSTLGADSQYLQRKFETYGPDLKRLPLTATYRHGPHLALAVGALMGKKSTSPLKLVTEINRRTYETNNFQQCARLAVDSIIEWRKEAKGKCAILIRDRHQSVYIENALMDADVGYELVSLKSYLIRDEILFLRGMVAIALKNLESVKSLDVRKAIVEALFVFGEVDIEPDEEYLNPLEFAKETIAGQPAVLNDFFNHWILKSKSNVRHRIKDVVEFVEGLPATTKADDVLKEICKRISIESLVKRINVYPYEASVVARSIEGFIDTAARSGKNISEFSEWLSQMEESLLKSKKFSVMLECVPNAKGMEFDHVILPFLEIGQFPDPTASAKEEENLFYVGVTRAKNRLTLLTPSEPRLQSPYIKRMTIESVKSEANACVEKAVPLPMRTELNVPYAVKDKAKALGAKWDAVREVWYVDPGSDLKPFDMWIA